MKNRKKTHLTDIGKFLRKLRIDQEKTLREMAVDLKVSPAFLSMVENGTRKIPSAWKELVSVLYHLSDEQISEWKRAVAYTEGGCWISFKGMSVNERDNLLKFLSEFVKH